MEWLQVIVLALIQGVTEFLPVSSSAHLILVPELLQWPDQGLAFDVAVHVGTLIAVIHYFRNELAGLAHAALKPSAAQREMRLTGFVLVATLPALCVGALFHHEIVTYLRHPLVIAAATIVFGLALLLANRVRADAGDEYSLDLSKALIIGAAQVLAFIPGTSRSGITILAGVMAGMDQKSASRFSFLLAIPVILGAGAYKTWLLANSELPVLWMPMAAGLVISMVCAWLCIHWFLKLIEKIGFTPFVIYRVLLGAVLLFIFV